MKVMTLGGAMRDIFIYYEDDQLNTQSRQGHTYLELEAGKKMEAERIELHSGGGAVNTAVSFSRLGFQTLIITAIGEDDYGAAVCSDLVKNMVDISAIKKVSDDMTGVSFIIPFPGGERTVMLYRGANRHLSDADIPDHLLSGREHIHISSLAGESARILPSVVRRAHQQGLTISLNPGTSQMSSSISTIIDSLPHLSVLQVNSHEAFLLFKALSDAGVLTLDQRTPERSISRNHRLLEPIDHRHTSRTLFSLLCSLSSLNVPTLVVTDGSHGVYVVRSDEILFHPAVSCTVVSTLGAGDAFASAFIASRLGSRSMEESLIMGIINSSSVICHEDTHTGLLTQEALEQRLSMQGLGNIQSYKIG